LRIDDYLEWIHVDVRYSESKGKEKLITNHSNALGEKKGYITLSVMLQEVSPKFLALKARYEKGETILGKPKLTYDRRSQFKILSGGNSKTQNWKGHAVMDEVWRIYQEGPCGIGNRGYTLPQTSQWLGLCPRIRNFCVNAGIIDPVEDPLNNIWQLREYIMGKKMFGTAEMLDKITELQKDNDRQQKIIASLSFRYLLEKLSPAGRGGAAMRWQMFWDAIWKEARDGHSKNPKLRDLVEAYDEKPLYLDQLNQHAKLMYSTLSTNIHKYSSGKVVLSRDQWDQQPYDILQALMPEKGLNAKFDWNAERKKLGYRYIAKKKNKKEGEEEMDTIGIANFDDVQNESE
jgi:hypothetical protein